MATTRNVDPQVARHRGRKARAIRYGHTQEAEAADRDLRAALLERRIREYAADAPPLTDTQKIKLALLLFGEAGNE